MKLEINGEEWTSVHVCISSYYDRQYENMFNCMWMIIVTFLSIGYGDIVPNTYCGRVIAVGTGVMVIVILILFVLIQPLAAKRQ